MIALPPIESVGKVLKAGAPALPKELIQGVLPVGGKLTIGGGSKCHKSMAAIDLALSVTTETPWLDWRTSKASVLYLNFEIQRPFFHSRVLAVAQHRRIKVEDLEGFDVWNLRGHAAPAEVLLPYLANQIQPGKYGLIVVDPLYKILGAADENAATDISAVLNAVERLAEKTGAAMGGVNHYPKGNQAAKEHMDRLAGSGVYARDADAVVTFTRLKEADCFAVEATVRNYAPPDPFGVRWSYPVFTVDNYLDPHDLKTPKPRATQFEVDDIIEVLRLHGPMTTTEWQLKCNTEVGISRSAFFKLKQKVEPFQAESKEGKWQIAVLCDPATSGTVIP